MSPRDWKLVVGPANDFENDGIELTVATNVRATWGLEEAPFLTFTVPATHQEAESCWELTHDVVLVGDNDERHFRGRIGGVLEKFIPDIETLEVQAVGYRGLLDRRIVMDGDQLIYTNMEQTDIAWSLIDIGQSRPSGDLGITRGEGQVTGIKRDRTYEVGSIHGEMLMQLGEVIDGFDWEIDGELAFNVWHPYRGTVFDLANPLTLDWGGMVFSVSRSWQSQSYSNVVRGESDIMVTEDEAILTTPVVRAAVNINEAPEGRWETGLAWPDISEQATLNQHVDAELVKRNQRQAEVLVQLRPGMWEGPKQLWLGDNCILQSPLRTRGVPDERTGLSSRWVRIMRIDASFSNDGGDPTVSLTVQEF